MSLNEVSLPAQHDNKNQRLQKSSVTSLRRSRIRPGKLGGNRGNEDNKASLRSKTLGSNTLGHKPDVHHWAKTLSMHLCFQVFSV